MIYAKSSPPQSLEDHTYDCLRQYDILQKSHSTLFSERDWEILRYAVCFHDIGKVNIAFQKRLKNAVQGTKTSIQEVEYPHGYLSPAFLNRSFFRELWGETQKTDFDLLVKLIFYHHAREDIDGAYVTGLKEYIKTSLSASWESARQEILSFVNDLTDTGSVSETVNTLYCRFIPFHEEWVDIDTGIYLQERYMKLKGTMNRIDYCASAGIDIEEDPLINGKSLADFVKIFMEQSGFHLRPVQQYLKENTGGNVIVTAATGCGKTEGALLWLSNRKGFYTLPLKTSINAIHKRIAKQIGYESAALLHSDAKTLYLEEYDEIGNALFQYQKARLFSSPLLVTTIDQLLRFVYKTNGTEPAAAALACGNLIIDEIQMYSPDLIAAILYALRLIQDMGGRYCIMTATFPKILLRMMREYGIHTPDQIPNFHGDIPYRHRMKLLKETEFPLQQICHDAAEKRVLILMNTVKHAQELHHQLTEMGIKPHLLHSRYLKKDRAILEREILTFAPNNPDREKQSGVWISTQVVEASLDIDFDVLYTELCSIDSLLQRMGRVYRSRAYDLNDQPNVYILDNRNIGPAANRIIDEEIYEYTKKALQVYDGVLLREDDQKDDKAMLMDLVYDEEKNQEIRHSNYYQKIRQKYAYFSNLGMYMSMNDQFREIDSITVMPEQIHEFLKQSGKMEAWKHQIQHGDYKEKIRAQQEMQQYTVSIGNFRGLDVERDQKVNEEEFYKCSHIMLYHGQYDFDGNSGIGLTLQYRKNEQVANFW